MNDTTTRRRIPRGLLVILLLAWGLLAFRAGEPYFGEQDAFRVWIASGVQNFDLYGLETTGLMMIRNSAPTTPDNFQIYSHHPPMLVWLPAVTTRFTDFNEVGVRFGFMAATLVSIAALYVIARRLYGEQVALAAAAFFAFTPMIIYFGRVPGMSQLSMAVAFLYVAVLVNWLRRPNRARLLALVGLAWLAVWTAWSAVFFVAVMSVAVLLLGRREHRVGVIGLGVVTVVAFAALMGFYQFQWDESIDSILNAFVWRTSSASGRRDTEAFTVLAWITQNTAHLAFFFTPGFFLLALVGIAPARKHGTRRANVLLAALFLSGLAYLLVFRNAAYIHHYYKAFLVPALAILAALAWAYTRRNPKVRRVARPMIDAFVITGLLTGSLVWGVAHHSGRQPAIQAMIDTINADASGTQYAIFMDAEGYRSASGYHRVIAFYTLRPILWDIPPEEAAALAVESDGPFAYIYCAPDSDPPPTLPPIVAGDDATTIYGSDDGGICRMVTFAPS